MGVVNKYFKQVHLGDSMYLNLNISNHLNIFQLLFSLETKKLAGILRSCHKTS